MTTFFEKVLLVTIRCVLQYFWGTVTLLNLIKTRITYGKDEERVYEKPECLDGWDSRFIDIGTVKLHYVQTGHDEKPLLLMIHGFPEFWYSWRFQLNYFKDKYRCVAVDMRGYNLSDKPSGIASYSLPILANDMKLLINKLGYEKAIIFSHDWGAVVAWKIAMVFPEVVERLVICNVPHPKAYRMTFDQIMKSWYMFMFQLPKIAEWALSQRDFRMLTSMFRGRKAGLVNRQNFTDEDSLAWKHVFSQPGALTPPINYYRALFREPLDRKDSMPLVQPPVLIIFGTGDHFLTKESAKMSVQFCRKAELYLLDGISHWVQQDAPEKVNARIDKFLGSNNPLQPTPKL